MTRGAKDRAYVAEVGRRIRAVRQARGWRVAHLARAAGMSHAALAGYERGAMLPSVLAAEKLALALDVTLRTLIPRLDRIMSDSTESPCAAVEGC